MNCESCQSEKKTLDNCDTEVKDMPFAAHEIAVALFERIFKKLWAVIIILIALLFGSNAAWLWYESQFETVETVEEYLIEQESESGNNNSIINGGEIINGKANN